MWSGRSNNLNTDAEERARQRDLEGQIMQVTEQYCLQQKKEQEQKTLQLQQQQQQQEVHFFENLQLDIFKTLFDKRQFSDFKLFVRKKEYNVHRAILAAQSPVFEAMFHSDMREANNGEVHIDDVEPEIMDKLLHFLYMGEIPLENLDDENVLVAAEKYQIEQLKSRCEYVLGKKLSIDNFYSILILSDQNNALNLKNRAMQFFQQNLKTFREAEDFKAIIDSLPGHLKTEIIVFIASQ